MEFIVVIIVCVILWYLFRVFGKSNEQIRYEGNKVDNILKTSEEIVNSNYNKVKKYTQQSISKNYLTGCNWLLTNKNESQSVLFTFRNSNELLVTTDGLVEKGEYELIVDSNSLLITLKGITEHYEIENFKDDFLFIRKMSTENVLIFANQTKFKDHLKETLNQAAKNSYQSYKSNSNQIVQSNSSNEKKYIYIKNYQQYGPVSLNKLRSLSNSGDLSINCLVKEINEQSFNKRLSDLL